MKRRDFLRLSAAGAAAGAWPGLHPGSGAALAAPLRPVHAAAQDPARDEAFWHRIRALYEPPADFLDFDQANTGATATPVFDAYVARARHLSRAPAERFGKMWGDDIGEAAYPSLARYLGTQPQHLAFTDSATVGLNTVLHGFPLERGDEVLVTDHEYPDMIETLLQRGRRDGIVMRVVHVPTPHQPGSDLAARVAEAITDRTRLLLISHVSAWSGEVLPVAEVTRVARGRGVAVLVDAAQSVGILDLDFERIGCDFLAASLHKWIGAPVASGALVMRPEQIGVVRPLHPPSWGSAEYPMTPYEWSGTFNIPARAAVADALAFQERMGAERKRARVRYLGDYWMDLLSEVQGVRLLTPRDPARSFGVASFMVDGMPSAALAKHLRQAAGVLVQDKSGRHSLYSNAIRVSPPPYATPRELDRLVDAVRAAARNGVPAAS